MRAQRVMCTECGGKGRIQKTYRMSAEVANLYCLHIPADHEHQFRFNVNTISGPT